MNFNKFLPVESYTLTTKLSVDEVRARIQQNTSPKKDMGFFAPKNNSSKPYEGSITSNSFKISRIINYTNSFLPIITGRVAFFEACNEIISDSANKCSLETKRTLGKEFEFFSVYGSNTKTLASNAWHNCATL